MWPWAEDEARLLVFGHLLVKYCRSCCTSRDLQQPKGFRPASAVINLRGESLYLRLPVFSWSGRLPYATEGVAEPVLPLKGRARICAEALKFSTVGR